MVSVSSLERSSAGTSKTTRTLLAVIVLLILGAPASRSASQSSGVNSIVQHTFVILRSGLAKVSVSLQSPVNKGDLVVVGVVFHSVDTGTVSDSLSNSFQGQVQNRSNICYPCAPDLGTGIWWSVVKSFGNDTVVVTSPNSTELVEVFDIRGASPSTIGFAGGGGWGSTPGLNAIAAQEVHDGNAFVLLIGGSVCEEQNSTTSLVAGICNAGPETCYPYGPIDYLPAQSSGFTIEPYCGTESPFTSGLIYGEYGVGDNTGGYSCAPSGNGTTCTVSGEGFTADLGVNPPLAGSDLGQIFYVDPNYATASTTAEPAHPFLSNEAGLTGAVLIAVGVTALVFVFLRRRSLPMTSLADKQS